MKLSSFRSSVNEASAKKREERKKSSSATPDQQQQQQQVKVVVSPPDAFEDLQQPPPVVIDMCRVTDMDYTAAAVSVSPKTKVHLEIYVRNISFFLFSKLGNPGHGQADEAIGTKRLLLQRRRRCGGNSPGMKSQISVGINGNYFFIFQGVDPSLFVSYVNVQDAEAKIRSST